MARHIKYHVPGPPRQDAWDTWHRGCRAGPAYDIDVVETRGGKVVALIETTHLRPPQSARGRQMTIERIEESGAADMYRHVAAALRVPAYLWMYPTPGQGSHYVYRFTDYCLCRMTCGEARQFLRSL